MSDQPDLEHVHLESKSSEFGVSLIWLVPLLAICAALYVAWENWSQKGPTIEVSFAAADGLEAGKTELRYRDIAVGQVEDLRFSDNLAAVVATIRLEAELAAFVDSDAKFWIVRPEVSAQGVSGLDTVLSGVYIAGAWDDNAGDPQNLFLGLDTAPLIPLGEEGVMFTLRSETELPPNGTPILYKGVRVGRVGPAVLDPGGVTVSAPVAVFAPHDQLVTSATRFWDISGIDFSLGVGGAQLDFDSLASLIAGGVTFDTLGSGGEAVTADAVFNLYPDEETARDEFLVTSDGGTVDVVAIFEENLPGLQTGAPVTLGGLRLGQVTAISGMIDPQRFGDNQARLRTVLRLNPGRLNLDASDGANGLVAFLETRVTEGLRARLTTASILTGGLKIELLDVAGGPPRRQRETADGLPLLPTAPAELSDVAGSAQSVLARIENLPVEDVLDQTIGLIADLRAVVGSEDARAAPVSLLATLKAVEDFATSEELAAVPAQVSEVAEGLNGVAAQLSAVLGTIEQDEVVADVAALIAALEETAQSLPSLSEEARGALQQARALPFDDVIVQLTAALADIQTLFADADLAALPTELREATQSLTALLQDESLRALPGTADASLQRIATLLENIESSGIVDGVGETVAALKSTAEGLPQLTAQAGRVLTQAEALELDRLLKDVSDVVSAVTAVLEQDSTKALPEELNQTLAELRTAMAELRGGGLIDNANATLAAARAAAEAISEASATLPALSNRLSAAAAQASSTLADFDSDGEFGRDFAAAISQVDAAAEALERLARQIARNPNSLITGR